MKKILGIFSAEAKKNGKMSDRVFKTNISISVLTILVCCAILCSSAFAWYNSRQVSPVAPVTSGGYSLSVEMGGDDLGVCDSVQTVTYSCPLTVNDTHCLTLESTGTVSGGYCVISINGAEYVVNVAKGESRTLSIKATRGTVIGFSASWGSYDGDIFDGDLIDVSETVYVEYTIKENDTLSAIAEIYGVSVNDIKAYNGITDVYNLSVGLVIKIPNAVAGESTTVPGDVDNTSDTSDDDSVTTFGETTVTTIAENNEQGDTETTTSKNTDVTQTSGTSESNSTESTTVSEATSATTSETASETTTAVTTTTATTAETTAAEQSETGK